MQGFKSFNKKIAVPFSQTFSVVCGPNGSGKSCRGDTQVMLNSGELKPIKEIVENALAKSKASLKLDDGVFTCENIDGVRVFGLDTESMKIVEKDVSAFVKREGEKKLFKITTRTGREVVTTGCHPVMVYRNGKVVSEVVEKLSENDFIAVPRKLEFPGNEFEMDGIKIDEDFARFIGYLIGDGYTTSNRIEIVNDEEAILNDFEQLCKKFGLAVKYKKKVGKATRIICWSTNFPKIVKNLLRSDSVLHLTGNYKIIPPEIMLSKKSVMINFLVGLFDCDATVRKNVPSFEYTTKSEKLADQVLMSLLRLGIVARKKKKLKYASNTKLKTRRPYFDIIIEGREKLLCLYENVPLRSRLKSERLKAFALDGARYGNNIDVLPQEVNILVHEVAKLLGMQVKPLRKKYPWLAAYNENRCSPTRKGIRGALNLFREKYSAIELGRRQLGIEKASLLESLQTLSIDKTYASEKIGLNRDAINNSWVHAGHNGLEKNRQRLHNFILPEINSRLEKSKEIIKTLENLANSDIFWDKLDKIEKTEGEKWVYDLTIPNCHNFIGNGIFVHNSNINDAICFVLGRTSAKSMRAERLHELIFHGGKSKEPAEIASVTLYLDNSKKEFPFDQDFITVTRKVNKSGVSVYKLNDETVTRQQVLDILSAVRVFPDGYNIVLQGDVTQIVEMDPLERREVIDEIAGIKEYDEKKVKSQKEFEKVEQKLKEVGFVLKERDETYKKLEQERNVALRYQEMTNELKKLRASIANKRLSQSEQSFTSLTSEIETKEKNAEDMSAKLAELDAEIDKKEQELETLMKTLFERSKKIKIVRDVEELRAKILRINDKIEYDKRELSRLEMITSRLEGISADQESRAVSEILKLGKHGVFGTIASLLRVGQQYQTAVEVAAGPHINDLIVDNENTAIECVNFLKNNKIGRATFLPLNKIQERLQSLSHSDTSRAVGWANELIEYDRKYEIAFKFVFGSTLVVKDIETARSIGIGKTRMVSLDGDLVERSGAIIGGFYRKRQKTVFDSKDIDEYKSIMGALRLEIETLVKQSKELSKELETKTELERSEASDFVESEKRRNAIQRESEALKRQRKTVFQERVNLQSELNKIKLQRARIEVERDNTKSEFSQYAEEKEFYDMPVEEMESKVRQFVREIDAIGAVNMKSIDEFENFRDEFEQLRKRYEEVIKERDSIMAMIDQIESRKKETFMKTFNAIAANFKLIFKEMAHGDGDISLEEPDNIYSGLTIRASPHGKNLLRIESMSGGEKTLTAMAFLFAIQNYKPAPFYIFDEIDAALDKANSKKIGEMIQRFSKNAQFILITHNDTTIRMADQVYGVSMDQGESKIISVQLPPEEE